jgi:hypothetical protein
MLVAQKSRKAGIRIETRPAEPVERSRAINECDCLAVTDDSVVFDVAGQLANSAGQAGRTIAFSSEVATGSREENASTKNKEPASDPIRSERL